MIASRPIHDLTRGLGRNAFDLPVAALAGLAAAVVAFAIPGDLLGQLVGATGLPHLLAAAEPPLGLKARGAIGIVGAVAAFGFVFMMMRMLDRSGRKKAEPSSEMEQDAVTLRLRRRDVHPDAPVCRPISATRDFGEPAPPPFVPAEPYAQPPEAEAPPAPAWSDAPDAPPERTEPPIPDWSVTPDEPLERTERPAPDWSAAPDEPLELTDRPAPSWLAQPEPELPQAVASEPQPRPVPADASLEDLMGRLERGLARRRTPQIFAPAPQQHAPAPAPAPQVFPEANDDRLQSAIESLQRFAARGD